MRNPIDERLAVLRKENRLGVMTHVVVGYPTRAATKKLVLAMERSEVDFVELQIPFSDPLADGPTIMKACEMALQTGTKVSDAFRIAKELQGSVGIPLLFMAYYNTVFKYGVFRFIQDAKKAGISGLIIPDMPIEEESHEHLHEYASHAGLHLIRVVAPVSNEKRLKKNAAVASGFVYASSRQGTTGARSELGKNITSFITKVKSNIPVPVAVGFGISKKEHVDMLRGHADIVVIGSAIIDIVHRSKPKKMLRAVGDFIRSLRVRG